MINPHGGTLVIRLVDRATANAMIAEGHGLTTIAVNRRVLADLELLALGAVSPLSGFLGRDDYLSVVRDMHLANGLPWSIPLTLAISRDTAGSIREGDSVLLVREDDQEPVAQLDGVEKFEYDRILEARNVYGTDDPNHPGVAALMRQGDVLLGGLVTVFRRNVEPEFARYALTPEQTRAAFADRGWKTVVGFQTRNPVHRAHEHIQKTALEIVDGLLLHPLVGETKRDDVPAQVRMRCYEVLLENYFPQDRVLLGVMPAAMRYAGPREAVFHALVRKNYGCTHFIVGRDHAGVGNYYGTYDAQRIFDHFDRSLLEIQILEFEHAFYCTRCAGMASTKTCPHDASFRVFLSGTMVRELLRDGADLPVEFTRPEVASVLRDAYRSLPVRK